MNAPKHLTVKINGTIIETEIYDDEPTTHAIAEEVTQTIRAIEESSDRIDTHRFALEACLKLAIELHRERDRYKELEDELGLQIASVNSSVETMLKLLD